MVKEIDKIRYWTQRILPQVYDDSLSYYELLNKVIEKMNEVIDQSNEYFSQDLSDLTLSVLNDWKEDGTLATIINNDVFNKKADIEYVHKKLSEQGYIVEGLHKNANYFNPYDKMWYEDPNFTVPAGDDTQTIQEALNKYGRVIIPEGSYSVGALEIGSNTQLIGQGKVTFHYRNGAGVKKNFPQAMITNSNQPDYYNPDDPGREYHARRNHNITIENITFDGDNVSLWGIQFIATDNVTIRNCVVRRCEGAVDLRAVRHSYINVYCEKIAGDGISVTDQNFAPGLGGKRGISENILFEKCVVTEQGATNTGEGTGKAAFEMDDGMSYITFRDCTAINNYGTGFVFHIHTNEYDIHHITFENCQAINNRPLPENAPHMVSGFAIGQVPEGSYLGDIKFINCDSIGNYISAFRRNPGAQQGTVKNITIDGGRWESTYNGELNRSTNYATIWLGKRFENVKLLNMNIKGAVDAYGIYTYENAGDLTINNCVITDALTPIALYHEGGHTIITNNKIVGGNHVRGTIGTFIYIVGENLTLEGNTIYMDVSNYSSSLVRIQTVNNGKISNNIIANIGELGNNAIYLQDNGNIIITNNIIKNFANAIFFSSVSESVIASINNCRGCTNIFNTTPTYLVSGDNVI